MKSKHLIILSLISVLLIALNFYLDLLDLSNLASEVLGALVIAVIISYAVESEKLSYFQSFAIWSIAFIIAPNFKRLISLLF